MTAENRHQTQTTRRRYDRIAPVYDLMEGVVEGLFFKRWREELWSQVEGRRVLDVGAGTGKNIPYYPQSAEVTAIDISQRMLKKAHKRADSHGREVSIRHMDAQEMDFGNDVFDAAVATFVFCSVPDAVKGLEEIRRVVVPGGRVYLLEHTRAKYEWMGRVMDFFDPLTVRLMGPHINRRTVENVRKSGLEISHVEELDSWGIFIWIGAVVPKGVL